VSRSSWRDRVTAAGTFFVVGGGLLWYVGSLPEQPWLAALVMLLVTVTGGLMIWSFADHAQDTEPASWHLPLRQESTPPMALDYRLVRLRRDLRDALERNDRPDTVHALVCDLAVERLQAHQGIDARTDPAAAQAVLPPELWRYLTTPPSGTARRSGKELGRALDQIERL
jgi:hypothetical protein